MVIWAEIARYISQEEGCYSIPDITLPKQKDQMIFRKIAKKFVKKCPKISFFVFSKTILKMRLFE